MHFCHIESWGVCVWCLGLLEDTSSVQNTTWRVWFRARSQGAVISFEGCDCEHCGCHGNFSLGRRSKGAAWNGGTPRSLQQLNWGPWTRLETGEGTGATPSLDLCLPFASVGVTLDREQILGNGGPEFGRPKEEMSPKASLICVRHLGREIPEKRQRKNIKDLGMGSILDIWS